MTALKLAIGVTVIALVCVSAATLPAAAKVEQTAFLNTNTPKKDGTEEITINFKKDGVNDRLSLTTPKINGKPKDDDDDPQTTEEEKATIIANAINAAAQAQGKPIKARATVDSVTVACAGGKLKKLVITNNTREKNVITVGADPNEMSLGSFALGGSAAGVDEESQPSFLEIGAGSTTRTFTLTPGMDLDGLRGQIQQEFENAGLRTSVVGTSVLIVLPDGEPRASLDLSDATLRVRLGVSAF